MTQSLLAALYALALWWLSTGLVLVAVRRLSMSRSAIMIGATAALGLGMWALHASSDDTTARGAFVAFSAALLVWAWHEISFLTGVVTGPRTTAAPDGDLAPAGSGRQEALRQTAGTSKLSSANASERAPLRSAIETLLYHELAILASLAAIVLLTRDGDNFFGLMTFVVLWVMRLSAKLNLYLGVPNLGEAFLPRHLAYLESYFCRRPMNYLFPVSVTVATAATFHFGATALSAGATAFESAGHALIAALLGLAVLEHWFMVLPFQATNLWRWGRPDDQAGHSTNPRTATKSTIQQDDACPATALTS